MLVPDLYRELIEKYSYQFALDRGLIFAVCMQETNFQSYKTRFEPDWTYFYLALQYSKHLGITFKTELTLQSMSWGPMQVMGSVARELGFDDYIQKLSEPDRGLLFGCKKLSLLRNKYSDVKDVISSYNAGTPLKNSVGQYKNQEYVDGVTTYMAQYSAISK